MKTMVLHEVKWAVVQESWRILCLTKAESGFKGGGLQTCRRQRQILYLLSGTVDNEL